MGGIKSLYQFPLGGLIMNKISPKVNALNISGVIFADVSKVLTVIYQKALSSGIVPSYTQSVGSTTYRIGKTRLSDIPTEEGNLMDTILSHKDKLLKEGQTLNDTADMVWVVFKDGEGLAVLDNTTKPQNLITQLVYGAVTVEQLRANPAEVLGSIPNLKPETFRENYSNGSVLSVDSVNTIVSEPSMVKVSDLIDGDSDTFKKFQAFLEFEKNQKN